MKPILNHIDNIVRPALRAYLAAEQSLTAAVVAEDLAATETAGAEVMRTARAAAAELHHLSDFVLHNPPPAFPDITTIRAAVQSHVLFLRNSQAPVPDDVALLRDTAEAFKHFKLDRPGATVADANAVVMISTGFGIAHFDEAKFGGVQQCMVRRMNGDTRAMSSVLQNVFDAWLTLLGQPLLPIGEY